MKIHLLHVEKYGNSVCCRIILATKLVPDVLQERLELVISLKLGSDFFHLCWTVHTANSIEEIDF